VLEAAGIEGLLSNREQLYADADKESQEWRDFVAEEWWAQFKSAPMKAGDLAVLVRDDELPPGLVATVKGEVTDKALSVPLGRALVKRKNQRIGRYFLRWLGRDPHRKGEVYALEPAEDSALPSEPSAHLPHDLESVPDSDADGAEYAECLSDTGTPGGKSGCRRGGPGGRVDREGRGSPSAPSAHSALEFRKPGLERGRCCGRSHSNN
jgi:hypothetical protein